ncbi:MAG: hypothetical protein ACKVQA_04920 [Burkholderiales bacterium]
MFNSPIHFCPVHKKYVALDETQAECMARHNCEADPCPLAQFFAEPAASNGEPAVAKAPVIYQGEV